MGYVIALAGKGGTGKTTTAALMVKILIEKKAGSILAIDADPNSNFAETLGLRTPSSIGEALDEIAKAPDKVPSGMGKDHFIEYQVQSIIQEGDGFDCLTMGRPEGPGCYCYVNNALRNVMGKLIKDYDYIVIDNEAGLEHLSRRTTRQADALVVVSDATKVGLRSAARLNELSKELEIKIKNRFLVLNRVKAAPAQEEIEKLGLCYVGSMPEDEHITKISLGGTSLMDLPNNAPSLRELRKIGDSIWQM